MQDSIEYARIADLYDTYVQTTLDVPFFLDEAKKTSGDVLELMSGTGRVSIPLAESGVRLTCVDRSPEMLAILREKLDQRGLAADVREMDVCALDLAKRFDLIIIPFHSFAEIISPDDQQRALTRIHEHLAPGGRFICTLHNPEVRTQPIDGSLKFGGKYPLKDGQGTLLFWIAQHYNADDKHVVEGEELFEEYDAGGVLRCKRLMNLRFRLIGKQEFKVMAWAAGFRVVALYGDYAHAKFDEKTSPFMIWVLKGTR